MARWVVRVERGGPWDWSKDMREQDGWDGHAAYMDGIFEEGFLLLAGPLEVTAKPSGWLTRTQRITSMSACKKTRGRRTGC